MSKLTAERVDELMRECLFSGDEDNSTAVMGEGVVHEYGFHPQRLEEHRAEIHALLLELPEQFQKSKGGGWSFLNGCMTKDGYQWGEQATVECLMALGNALGLVTFPIPRDIWNALPGGVPYFTVADPVPQEKP